MNLLHAKLPTIALGVAGVALLLLALSGPAYRLGVPLGTAFTILRWGAYFGLAAMVLGAIAVGLASRRRDRLALGLGAGGLVIGLIAFGIPYSWQRTAASVPPIHDITTDLENPPEFEAVVPLRADAPNTLERPSELAEQQRRGYPDLAPITVSRPPEEAFDAALALAQARGWEIVTADRSTGRIEATDTTRWFGFKDDVVIRITPWGSGARVDMRSVSRVGRSDVGTNARRIRSFLEDLEDS